MTREEAVNIIKSECYVFNPLNLDRTTKINTALDVAVEALEREPILDKVRAEIADLDDADYDYEGYYKAVTDALQIIDKYKAETEKVNGSNKYENAK